MSCFVHAKLRLVHYIVKGGVSIQCYCLTSRTVFLLKKVLTLSCKSMLQQSQQLSGSLFVVSVVHVGGITTLLEGTAIGLQSRHTGVKVYSTFVG